MIRAASVGVVVVAALASMLLYPQLPAVMAIHWNAHGQADGFAPKAIALGLMPAIMLLLFFVLAAFARRAPGRAYEATALATQVFMLFVHGVTVAVALGVPIAVERAVPFGISLLFVVIGFFMPGLQPNPVMGIRVRWTMRSPEVWRATHLFAGRLFVGGGLLLAAGCLAGVSFWAVFAGFLALGFLPIAYAAAVFRS